MKKRRNSSTESWIEYCPRRFFRQKSGKTHSQLGIRSQQCDERASGQLKTSDPLAPHPLPLPGAGMIDRYTRPRMKAIWDMKHKYQIWLDVELAACAAFERAGQVPR